MKASVLNAVSVTFLAAVGCLAALLAWPASAIAQEEPPIIHDIVVEGGVTLTIDTVSYYLGLEPGDPLDRIAIAEGYHRLWDSGLFEDLRIEIEALPDDEVNLIISVSERPFVRSVVFEGNDKVSSTTLKDKLDEASIELPRNVPLQMASLSRIQTALHGIYESEGYRSASIDYRIDEINAKERRVVFEVEEGGKVKIAEILFEGNSVYSNSRLRRVLKKTKQTSFFRFMGAKILYQAEAWEEDRENLRKHYLNHGYKDIKIGQPEVALFAKRPDAEKLKKKKYRLQITIPVEEGEPYALGELTVRGAEVFSNELLRKTFEVVPGKTYNFKLIDAGMEKVRSYYHNSGYIYAYANQVLQDREDEDHVVDVIIDVFEGDRFKLGRLEFAGNTSTREKVLRREFRITEGSTMNMGLFRASVFKVNALGFFKLEEDPLEFDFDDENKRVNVIVKGNEVGRNDIQFGAGYSEIDGAFAQAMFNTRNFLGRGETLGVSLQSGRRTDYYSLSFSEPYLFDRRIMLGGSLFKTNVNAYNYYRETEGGSISTGLGLRAFASMSVLLSYEKVYSRFPITNSGLPGEDTGGHVRPLDPPPAEAQDIDRAYEEFRGTTAALTPSYAFDTRDDPFDPSQGTRLTSRLRLAGGPLGGHFDYIRPEITYTLFRPMTKRSVFACNAEVAQFFTYEDSEIPLYERYRMGGERTLRGLPYYSVMPRDEEGGYFYSEGGSQLGGDRYWLLNVELQFKVGGPVKAVLFTDLGNTYHEDQGWDFSLFRRTAGVEIRVFLPIFQAPIRFIYGYNLDPLPEEKTSDFQFSIGTTF